MACRGENIYIKHIINGNYRDSKILDNSDKSHSDDAESTTGFENLSRLERSWYQFYFVFL